jgi:hypothetical protein
MDVRTRLAVGAVLAVAAGLAIVLLYEAAHRSFMRNPSDAELARHFRAHRATYEAERRGGPAGSETLYFAPRAAWYPRVRFGDVKGVVFAARAPEELVENLDAVVVPALGRGKVARWYRALEGDWYLYREVRGGRR